MEVQTVNHQQNTPENTNGENHQKYLRTGVVNYFEDGTWGIWICHKCNYSKKEGSMSVKQGASSL